MCRRWRQLCDFFVSEWNGQKAVRWQSYCSTCKRLRQRERLAERLGRPVLARSEYLAFHKKYPSLKAKAQARQQRHNRRMATDRQYAEHYREYHRMYQTLKRRANGVPERNFKSKRYSVDRERPIRLPIEPFAEYLRRMVPVVSAKIPGSYKAKSKETITYDPLKEIAEICDVSRDFVYDVLRGHQNTVDIDRAERVLIGLNGPQTWELWPELDE
jgi:hypothetical protein